MWTSYGLVYWRIYATLGLNEFTNYTYRLLWSNCKEFSLINNIDWSIACVETGTKETQHTILFLGASTADLVGDML